MAKYRVYGRKVDVITVEATSKEEAAEKALAEPDGDAWFIGSEIEITDVGLEDMEREVDALRAQVMWLQGQLDGTPESERGEAAIAWAKAKQDEIDAFMKQQTGAD